MSKNIPLRTKTVISKWIMFLSYQNDRHSRKYLKFLLKMAADYIKFNLSFW